MLKPKHGVKNGRCKIMQIELPKTHKNVKLNRLLVLPAAGILSACCAVKSPDLMPVQPPRIPSLPPVLEKPVPQESYLERAQKDIEDWRKKLTDSASN